MPIRMLSVFKMLKVDILSPFLTQQDSSCPCSPSHSSVVCIFVHFKLNFLVCSFMVPSEFAERAFSEEFSHVSLEGSRWLPRSHLQRTTFLPRVSCSSLAWSDNNIAFIFIFLFIAFSPVFAAFSFLSECSPHWWRKTLFRAETSKKLDCFWKTVIISTSRALVSTVHFPANHKQKTVWLITAETELMRQ